jgi:hypothetical protein
MQALGQKIIIGERALENDYELMKESSSLIDSLSCGVQVPLNQQLNDVALPKVTVDLVQFKKYLTEKFGTISATSDPNK